MTMAQSFLQEFEQELRTTRKFLERLPERSLTWKPHEKSMTAGQLALHIAKVPGGIAEMASQREAPAPDFSKGNPQPATGAEVLAALDRSAATVRRILPTFTDAQMEEMWSAVANGKPLLTMPRGAFIRSIMLNHWYHHRGQFGVYLRLLGAAVPASYGPSADEAPDFAR